MNNSVSIVVLCYNEAINITNTLNEIMTKVPEFCSDFEVLVIDDGSTDSSYEEAKVFEDKYPEVKIIQHKTNIGLGQTIKTGIANSIKDFVFITAGDNQFDILILKKMLNKINTDVDIVIGRRTPHPTKFRNLLSYLHILFLHTIFGIDFHNTCGVNLYRRDKIQNLDLKLKGILTTGEIIIQAVYKYNSKLKFVNITYRPREHGSSKMITKKVMFNIIYELFLLWYYNSNLLNVILHRKK